jgi:hypothetical protein
MKLTVNPTDRRAAFLSDLCLASCHSGRGTHHECCPALQEVFVNGSASRRGRAARSAFYPRRALTAPFSSMNSRERLHLTGFAESVCMFCFMESCEQTLWSQQ